MTPILRRKPGSRRTTADAIRSTLYSPNAVLLSSRAKVGGYHALMAKERLILKQKRVKDGWLVWVEKPEKRR